MHFTQELAKKLQIPGMMQNLGKNNLFLNYMYFDDRIYEYISGIKLKHLLNTELKALILLQVLSFQFFKADQLSVTG